MSYGLFKSKGWAWTITIILSIISIAISIIFGITGGVLSLSNVNTMDGSNSLLSGIIVTIIGIAIDVVIIYYLCRPNVKAFFGKTTSEEPQDHNSETKIKNIDLDYDRDVIVSCNAQKRGN